MMRPTSPRDRDCSHLNMPFTWPGQANLESLGRRAWEGGWGRVNAAREQKRSQGHPF
jgi:hypothetical protein